MATSLLAQTPAAPAVTRTPAEVEALIQQAGRTPPDWWDATPLNYPKTLDLTWSKPDKQWNNQKHMGQYLWDIVNNNPNRWREGIKLVHQTLPLVKDDDERLEQAERALGHLYGDCLGDWPRAAFWYRKTFAEDFVLAELYWKMGSRGMAAKELTRYGADDTRNGRVIKLWADLGDLATALKIAEAKAREDTNPDAAYLAAGDACRLAGQYPQAVAYYQKVLTVVKAGGDIKRNQNRARASIDAIKMFDALDLKRVPDGVYQNESLGYEAPVVVEVTVKAGRIVNVVVKQHREKQYYSSIIDTSKRIIAKQGVKGVDVTSGATITSEAIINASAKALAGGMK